MSDGDDLVDALYTTDGGSVPRRDYERVQAALSAAQQSLQQLQEDNSKRKRQNAVLLRNISTLFRTAVAEIERKDLLLRQAGERADALLLRERLRDETERKRRRVSGGGGGGGGGGSK